MTPLTAHCQNASAYKSEKYIENAISERVISKIQKAEQMWDQRGDIDDGTHRKLTRREFAIETIFINELNKVENNFNEPLDKDKRIYKQVILANAVDSDADSFDYVKIQRRTVKNQIKDPDFEYKIRVNPYCQVCKKVLPQEFIDSAIPKDNEKVLIKDKIKKEIELLKY